MTNFIFEMIFLLCASGFIVCIKLLSSPKTARLGNTIGAIAMIVSVIFTLILEKPAALVPVIIAMVAGSVVGIFFAQRVKMTAMPQMVALFNGVGGLASVLVSLAEAQRLFDDVVNSGTALFSISSWFSIAIGAITFTGSLIAFLKLQELMPTRPILVQGQRIATVLLFVVTCAIVFLLLDRPDDMLLFTVLAVVAGVLGVLLVIPIGGADMPVVISLLNSYSGLAALAAGFVINSNILIISGSLVGASGVILTRLMCKAMNRSLTNVVFGAFGGVSLNSSAETKAGKEFSPMDAAMLLHNASRVIIVPGYGLAVSQAQSNLRELADVLKKNGVQVSYAIHPVAGRMPGHMNVLLAEADIPYEELFDLDQINSDFETADVAVIIGANDVVNPSARTEKTSPLYGMPILNADKARSVVVLKRGRGHGFAGVENPLFTLDHAGLVFGDAKQSMVNILQALKELQE